MVSISHGVCGHHSQCPHNWMNPSIRAIVILSRNKIKYVQDILIKHFQSMHSIMSANTHSSQRFWFLKWTEYSWDTFIHIFSKDTENEYFFGWYNRCFGYYEISDSSSCIQLTITCVRKKLTQGTGAYLLSCEEGIRWRTHTRELSSSYLETGATAVKTTKRAPAYFLAIVCDVQTKRAKTLANRWLLMSTGTSTMDKTNSCKGLYT